MRVVLYEPSGSGGIFHYTFELAESLSRSSVDVTLLTKEGHELSELKRSFRIKTCLGKSQIKSLLMFLKTRVEGKRPDCVKGEEKKEGPSAGRRERLLALRRLIQWLELVFSLWRQRPDVIHFQWVTHPDQDYYLLKLLKFFGFKIVYTAHNLLPHVSTSRDKEIFKRLYQVADRIIVHAVKNKEEMVEEFSIDPRKVSVVPHGAYRLFYQGRRATREEAREALDIPQNRSVVLFFGSIQRYKGLEYLVDAFRKVRERIDNIMLLIVGQVPSADKEAVACYSKLLDEVEKEDHILLRRGYIDFDKVGPYFLASDLVVLPYVKTYQSGILMLAYGAGTPVIVTETGGLGEVVEEGKSGFVVPPREVEPLTQAIISTVQDPERLKEMGRYAKCLAEGKYSWEEVARQTVEVYRSAARSSGGEDVAIDG